MILFCNVAKYSKILYVCADDRCIEYNNLCDASLLQYDLQTISEWAVSCMTIRH